ncbi:MAG: hypothetical protein U1A77_09315 [Pirellulales bacterium]
MSRFSYACCAWVMPLVVSLSLSASEPPRANRQQVADELRQTDSRVLVLGTVRQPPLALMLSRDVDARMRTANQADREAWHRLRNREDWIRHRDQALAALRKSLGDFPSIDAARPEPPKIRITGSVKGNGYQVDKLVYATRPGLIATANLYRPERPQASMPGLVICHSHQSTKHSSWRQDMGATWARAGCTVLIPDHLGHGERRQHAFGDEPPHDYHFRFDLGMQLHLVGESLMGWMVWDLMRGLDVLLSQPGIDLQRVILISEPAGGGDVAAVTAALDRRISCAMVQNFGGPEPENSFPLDKDAEKSFDFSGVGSWESTRNLRLSARDGFLPWTIVGAVAPRRLIYYHEFYWDKAHDPVWKRFQQIYAWEKASDSLVGIAGRGFVVGSSPENSHWLPGNRELLYPTLERWFKIPHPGREFSERRPEAELHCLNETIRQELGEQPAHVLAGRIADQRLAAARSARSQLTPDQARARLQLDLRRLLGDLDPQSPAELIAESTRDSMPGYSLERLPLITEPGIVVPTLLIWPQRSADQGAGPKPSVVVAVAQQGKEAFLRERSPEIAKLLEANFAICLPDVRGVGETSPGEARDRRSAATSISSSEWMLGQSLLGGRLRDLRSVIGYLRARSELNAADPIVWGESFAPVNSAEVELAVPYTADRRPHLAEPLGELLALLVAVFDDNIRSVTVSRGLADFRSALSSPYVYVPHDAVIPGLLTTCDIPDLVAAIAPRTVTMRQLVDGSNQSVVGCVEPVGENLGHHR